MPKHVLFFFKAFSDRNMCKIPTSRLGLLTRSGHFSALVSGYSNQEILKRANKIFLERYLSTGTPARGELHPFDPVYTNLIIENIYKEIQSWMCKRVDTTDSQKLPVLERATALNRLLMTHCFDVLLTRDCPFSKYELHSPDDEICLPAICAIIDKAKQYEGNHFIIGTLQYRKLDTLSKILDVSPESIFMNVMNCRSRMSGVQTSAPYMDDRKKPDVTVTLAGNSSYSSTIFPLTLGVTKAFQQLEGDINHNHVWSIICYDSNDIKDKSIYSNIIQTSCDANFFTGGSIHVVLNEVEEELSMKQEKENQCKFLKIFADFLKAPIVHVKADDVDSVINVMHLVADFKNTHKRDIVVNLIVNQPECYPIKQLSLPELMEELITNDKAPLAATYMKHLVANKVISDVSYEKRKEELLASIQEMYSRHDFVVLEDKTSSNVKPTVEPPTACTLPVLQAIGEAMSNAPKGMKISSKDSELFDSRKTKLAENKLDWSCCELMAQGALLQEETNIHMCSTKKCKKKTLLVQDSASGLLKNILCDRFPFMGKYTLCQSGVPEYTMAGFEMGYSTVTTNSLNIWMAPDVMQSCVLQSILKHYLLYTIRNAPSRATFVIPDYCYVYEKKNRKYQSTLKKHIINIYYGMMEGKAKSSKPRCTIVNISSPANYFHVLRKQAKTPKICPLVVYVPHKYEVPPECFSTIEELSGETGFQPFLQDDADQASSEVQHVILCSGKIYFELEKERSRRDLKKQIAIGRLEQVCPFPMSEVMEYLRRFEKAKVWWAQQEQFEDGWWLLAQQNLKEEGVRIKYAGRCHATRPDYSSPQLSTPELAYIFDMMKQNP